jgi:predicted ribosome quality control (RQC) complex YloA/Tae2 family protein
MKTEILFIQGLNREITFYIGQNKNENFDVIDNGSPDDLWFHANDESSCHVVANVPNDISKKDKKYIIKAGALLCKNNTNKLKKIKNVEFIYTQIKNIQKTIIPGCVTITNDKQIIII